jgi:hypothetical protein
MKNRTAIQLSKSNRSILVLKRKGAVIPTKKGDSTLFPSAAVDPFIYQ